MMSIHLDFIYILSTSKKDLGNLIAAANDWVHQHRIVSWVFLVLILQEQRGKREATWERQQVENR